MNKKTKVIATTLIFMSIFNSKVYADPLSDQLKNKNKQLIEEKSKFKEINNKKEDLEVKVEILDSNIESIMRTIDGNEIQIEENKNIINIFQNNIVELQEDLENEKEMFNKRMRAMYINGSESYLDLLLSSKGFDEVLSKIEIIKTIITYDKETKTKIINDRKELENKKIELEEKEIQLTAFLNDNKEKLNTLNMKQSEQNLLLSELKKQEKLVASNVQRTKQNINEITAQINGPSTKTKNINSSENSTVKSQSQRMSRGGTSLSANDVIAYAKTFLGVPYRWGGTTPKGFDCSGFTQYVYKRFGINLTRTTFTQINDGTRITKANLKPGDLVFFGTSRNPHHMGMYVGNNQYIHAPRTGDVVKISPMTRKDFITGVRLF